MKNLTKMLAVVSAMVFFVNTADAQEAMQAKTLVFEEITVSSIDGNTGELRVDENITNLSDYEGLSTCCSVNGQGGYYVQCKGGKLKLGRYMNDKITVIKNLNLCNFKVKMRDCDSFDRRAMSVFGTPVPSTRSNADLGLAK